MSFLTIFGSTQGKDFLSPLDGGRNAGPGGWTDLLHSTRLGDRKTSSRSDVFWCHLWRTFRSSTVPTFKAVSVQLNPRPFSAFLCRWLSRKALPISWDVRCKPFLSFLLLISQTQPSISKSHVKSTAPWSWYVCKEQCEVNQLKSKFPSVYFCWLRTKLWKFQDSHRKNRENLARDLPQCR